MAASLEHDSLLYAAGFRLIGTSVNSLVSPSLTEEVFGTNLQKLKALRCELFMCNVLFPASLKIAGPTVDEEKVMAYLNAVLVRTQKAGVKNLVLGSGGARRLPDGYDKQKAATGFVELAKKMAAAAKEKGVTILLENLNSTETNFLNKLADAADIVRQVGHKNFRLNADVYHMLKEGESPNEIRRAGDVIVYCELAEKEQRTLPGVAGDDFTPYLQALKDIGFKGPIVIEGKADNLPVAAPRAFAFLSAQLQRVHEKNE